MARRSMSEFELIGAFTRPLKLRGEGVVLGVGDDAAVLSMRKGELIVATVDAVVEGVHFDKSFHPFDVGYKALAVNLSDVAAMGARPLWALVALALPREAVAEALGIARGLAACAKAHAPGLSVVGGNVTRASERSVTVTLLGAVERGAVLTRSGARAGHLVAVTGTLGDAALGLGTGSTRSLALRQRRPTPRILAGQALSRIATAAIDVSDGLVQDLRHVCQASKVGAEVEMSKLPLSSAALRLGRARAVRAALSGGEDYELCLAIPKERLAKAERAAHSAGTALTVIGRFVGRPGVRVTDASGRPVRAPEGHDHMRSRQRGAFQVSFPRSREGRERSS